MSRPLSEREAAPAAKGRGRSTPLALLLVPLVLGGALRFWFAWSWRAAPQFPSDPEEGYYGSAIELLGRGVYTAGLGDGVPRAWRGPIYPTFIAMVQSVSDRPLPGLVRLAQAAVSTLSIALVFALGAASVSPLAGFAAASALALSPSQISQVASLNIHGFYSFWLLLLACFAVSWIELEGAVPAAAALGAVLGAGLLCRSSHFLSAALLLGAGAAWWGSGARALRGLGAFCVALILAVAPMAVRNAVLFSRMLPLPDRDAGSVVFYCGTIETATIDQCNTVEQALTYAEAEKPGFRAAARAHPEILHPALFDLAVRRIEAAPWRYARLCLRRAVGMWTGLGLYLALAACGVLLAPRNRPLWGVVLVTASFLGYSFGGGTGEHMEAAIPLLTTLAACGGVLALRSRLRSVPAPFLSPRRLPRPLLRLSAGFAAAIYAAMLGFLALEAGRYWLAKLRGLPPPENTAGVRELAALRVAAENGRTEDAERYRRALSELASLRGAPPGSGRPGVARGLRRPQP